MGLEHNHRDEAVDRVLAALRDAAPPEGMETRLHQRLTQAAALPQPAAARLPAVVSCWKAIFAGSTLAGAWARGALTGAAVALLTVAAVLLLQRSSRPNLAHPQTAANYSAAPHAIAPTTPASSSPQVAPTAQPRGLPCLSPHLLRADTPATVSSESYRPASFAPSRPAPELPLTAQERELARLAQTADPRLLAALAPETQARLDAQETDNFNKFFAPLPAPPPAPPDDASPATNDQSLTPTKAGETL
jgi:hypothetical protein